MANITKSWSFWLILAGGLGACPAMAQTAWSGMEALFGRGAAVAPQELGRDTTLVSGRWVAADRPDQLSPMSLAVAVDRDDVLGTQAVYYSPFNSGTSQEVIATLRYQIASGSVQRAYPSDRNALIQKNSGLIANFNWFSGFNTNSAGWLELRKADSNGRLIYVGRGMCGDAGGCNVGHGSATAPLLLPAGTPLFYWYVAADSSPNGGTMGCRHDEPGRFVTGEGGCMDERTGLVWGPVLAGIGPTAVDGVCRQQSWGGHRDWRLPSNDELAIVAGPDAAGTFFHGAGQVWTPTVETEIDDDRALSGYGTLYRNTYRGTIDLLNGQRGKLFIGGVEEFYDHRYVNGQETLVMLSSERHEGRDASGIVCVRSRQ